MTEKVIFFFSANSTITSSGDQCIDKCRRRGQQYYWCHKETTLWGFCTPDFLIQRTGKKNLENFDDFLQTKD